MSTENSQCVAMTKGGDQCRNRAVEGSDLCTLHARTVAHSAVAEDAAAEPVTLEPAADVQRETVEAVAEELNKIADEVKKKDPKYTPPPFSPEALKNVLKANLDTLSAYMPIELARDIIRNLEGTKPSDLLDPETWKGLWYILNYTAQAQAKGLADDVLRRVNAIPGMDMVTMFGQSVYESPRDLLDVETWKGAAVVLNAATTASLSALKRKMLGQTDEA